MDKLKLHVIAVSTRPGRVGPGVSRWMAEVARTHGRFEVALVDLASFDLPVFDEAGHPMQGNYANGHTQRWSASVDQADAFVFVTPEYDFSTPPSLSNALIYLFREWHYKPVGFVSYGGLSGGMRSVQMTKQIATALKMMPIPEAVAIPFVHEKLGHDGNLRESDGLNESALAMLDELHRWAAALRPLRVGELPAALVSGAA